METGKYIVIVGMCGYLPDTDYCADTLQDVRYILADIRANLLPSNWRNSILTPVRDLRAWDILNGGVGYYNDRDTYVEVFGDENN